jgi:hypothetical protein
MSLGKKRFTRPDARTHAMLQHLQAGETPVKAARLAGYGARYARNYGAKMARSARMKAAMLEVAKGIKPGGIGTVGEGAYTR